MERVFYRRVEVDRCTGCKGLWFDALEEETLAALSGSESVDSGEPRVGKRLDEVNHIECPVCSSPMIRMVDRRQSHIWYESCTVCYGVFFDAGEFTDLKQQTFVDRVRSMLMPERG